MARQISAKARAGSDPSEEIAITFGVSNEYSPHMAAVIASIIRNAPGAHFRFVVLHPGISDERRAAFESFTPGCRFDWIKVGPSDVPDFFNRDHYVQAILYRLGLERLAPADCKRIIYLDVDLIVTADIRELWNYDLEGFALGAIEDPFIKGEEFARRWDLPFNGEAYFNSGVMLIDLELVRKEGAFTKAMEFVAEHDRELRFSDQDGLNSALWGRWQPLPTKWNAQRCNVMEGIVEDLPEDQRFFERLPAVVHFVGPEKPWVTEGYHPWSWIYWDNLARTPFFDEVARTEGVGRLARFKLWLRWMRWRPARRARAAA